MSFFGRMKLIEEGLYHFYNQGNNRELIFFKRGNQLYFLHMFKKFVLPKCEVLAYSLMPNHFHFLLYTTSESLKEKKIGHLTLTALNNGFRQLLSTYAQAINKQEYRTGSVFRPKTKAKFLEEGDPDYPFICFQYIHQNPLRAGLVEKMEDWEFSSFRDYLDICDDSICNKELAFEIWISKRRSSMSNHIRQFLQIKLVTYSYECPPASDG